MDFYNTIGFKNIFWNIVLGLVVFVLDNFHIGINPLPSHRAPYVVVGYLSLYRSTIVKLYSSKEVQQQHGPLAKPIKIINCNYLQQLPCFYYAFNLQLPPIIMIWRPKIIAILILVILYLVLISCNVHTKEHRIQPEWIHWLQQYRQSFHRSKREHHRLFQF